MKKILLPGTLICAIGMFVACNNNQSVSDSADKTTQEKEIVYNDKIQNTFFGVPFGSSKDEVVAGFAKQDFYENYYSTDARLSFNKKTGRHGLDMECFSFGGLNWDQLYVNLTNNQFQSIQFTNAFKTKESALEYFDNVLSAVSAKYNMYEDPINDTSSYRRYIGETKSNQWVLVSCYSYESANHKRWVGVTLAYGDNNFDNVSDEL